VDTKARLAEYCDLAHTLGDPLAIAIEIDVGLRRGGARNPAELLEMLDILARQRNRLRFTGLMGYDGHVPFAPPGFDSDAEFAAVHERYMGFVQAGN
jgi:D-serine deaminase-like pyridoxal phosphate-dependent protein